MSIVFFLDHAQQHFQLEVPSDLGQYHKSFLYKKTPHQLALIPTR
ncbi:hypothetical protein VDIAB_110402 [Vibrio diabolicus]|nr:hypothetical protein VDIAB_110402 [Vibrio diabolicus]